MLLFNISLRKSEVTILNKEQLFISPNLVQAKKRGKEEIKVINFDPIPDDMKNIGYNKFYLIRTYGCQMNSRDSDTMAGILEQMGFQNTLEEKEADVIIYNTCAVRENAEDKVFGELGRLKFLKQEKPDLILALAGCMAQEEETINRILRSYQHVDLVFGTHNIHRLPLLLKEAYYGKEMIVEVWSKEGDIIEQMPTKLSNNIKAFVNIMYGCDKFCTYCIVPYTRGKERSRYSSDIIKEVDDLYKLGYKEITLLGQNVNAYGKDFTNNFYGFADLLKDLTKIKIPRIRFTTSHPKDFDDELIKVLAQGGNLVEHIHLPVQSGNSEILKLMGRNYTREDYLKLIEKIKKLIPNVALTTDIIVGFPNETEEQFLDTLSMIELVEYDAAYTFVYSKRQGTPATKMLDNVAEEVKKERLQRLMTVQNAISLKKNKQLIGQNVEILVEGESKTNSNILTGRTRTNKVVNFVGDKSLIGNLIYVRIIDAKTWTLTGEYIPNERLNV